ncbi:glycosyltransferase [cf. Phormidesmis sp. LEGE 11477]|uniref:glycosyltransferase n=1 Tax=cf. Phormidesmis sp. LEGE 11477 TaxID=1828680 RepID=UPI001880F885|nr:glycosyltransferase [cf. Phormidesmis sp. LEGE 11477]MBE9064669.1 glycosyltransferase [cf. Phormidesmis sp. LEGE 11477]
MRKLLFLLPGTTKQFFAGGLTAELNTLRLAQQICEAEVVTYRQREPGILFLDDLLSVPPDRRCIFVVSWGFDVPKLLKRLGDRPTIYHAHSTGYGFVVPPRVPILAVSNNTMSYWGEKALGSLIYHLPNEISSAFENRQLPRDIDVLVQTRKSSEYLLQQLLPALKKRCHVVVLDSYVEDLIGLFNRTKVYLYDTAEYWGRYRLSEGFGLPPMEALACGCQVFSSVNHALSDYLDPGFNCQKIAGYSTSYDTHRILETLQREDSFAPVPDSFFAPYRRENLIPRLATILTEINAFFDHQVTATADIPQLTRWRIAQLSVKRILSKLKS